ncbi:MAG TPA: hypothetical protein VFJ23_07615 [Candidatus Nitrosotalea sp.]|nr:hypothetical protein [Candidatus Nitrosotalea sp.]
MQILVVNKLVDPELPVIIWKKTRVLKWRDFRKKPDVKSNASASSAIGFESKPFIEHIKAGNKFRFKIKDMQFNAVFIPDLSWVMKNISKKNSKSLLKHEQGHFDLAEEITRKTRTKTTNRFHDRTLIVKGKNEDIAKRDAILQTAGIRRKIEDKLQSEFKSQETKYDDKTNHGLITEYQEKYNKRFEKLRV